MRIGKGKIGNIWRMGVILFFCAVSLVLILNHEPWADEAQAWLIARDSNNLLQSVRYEVTPGLWHFILYPFAKAGMPYFTAQIIHFFIILAAVIIFVTKSPFTRLQKTFFILGYYVIYEYNVIARSYVLTVLFLFLIADCYQKRYSKPLLYSILLFLLANCNLQSLFIAGCLAVSYWYELLADKKNIFNNKYFSSLLIVCAGILFSVYQLLPPGDASLYRTGILAGTVKEAIGIIPVTIIGAFLPVPLIGLNFWNTKLFYSQYHPTIYFYFLAALLTLSIIIFTFLFFLRFRKFMKLYLFLFGGMVALFLLKHHTTSRHQGLIFLVFIFLLWIAMREYKISGENNTANRRYLQFMGRLLTGLLFLHVIGAAIAFHYELKYPFSSNKNIAAFLEKNNFAGKSTLIATYPSLPALSILLYVHRKDFKLFCLESNRLCSFVILDKTFSSNRRLEFNDIKSRINNFMQKGKENYTNVLFITRRAVAAGNYKLIAYFDKAIAEGKRVYIYKLEQ